MKREQLIVKKKKLLERLAEAERLETERFARIPWGAGMRWSRINFSTRRSDELRSRIKALDELIEAQKEETQDAHV